MVKINIKSIDMVDYCLVVLNGLAKEHHTKTRLQLKKKIEDTEKEMVELSQKLEKIITDYNKNKAKLANSLLNFVPEKELKAAKRLARDEVNSKKSRKFFTFTLLTFK